MDSLKLLATIAFLGVFWPLAANGQEDLISLDSMPMISMMDRPAQAAAFIEASRSDEYLQKRLPISALEQLEVGEHPRSVTEIPLQSDQIGEFRTLSHNQLITMAGPLPKTEDKIEAVRSIETTSDEMLEAMREPQTFAELVAKRHITTAAPVFVEASNRQIFVTAKYRDRQHNPWRDWPPLWNWNFDSGGNLLLDAGLGNVVASPRALISSEQFGRRRNETSNAFIAAAGPEKRKNGTLAGRVSVFDGLGNSTRNHLYASYGNLWNEFVAAVPIGETNEILFVGTTGRISNSGSRLWLVKYDPEIGVALWSREIDLNRDVAALKTYDGSQPEELPNLPELKLSVDAVSAARSPSGDFIVVGRLRNDSTDTTFRQNTDLFVAAIDSNGDIVWARACGGYQDDWGTAIEVLPDGGMIVGGTTLSVCEDWQHHTKELAWLLKLDAQGYVIWDTTLESDGVLAVSVKDDKTLQAADLDWRLHTITLDESSERGGWWAGNHSWTKGRVFKDPFGSKNPNLTCLNIYWQPSDKQIVAAMARGRFIDPLLAITDRRLTSDAFIDQ